MVSECAACATIPIYTPFVGRDMLDRILVAMDDSEMGERSLRYALDAFPESEITVLHVVGTPSPMGGQATGLTMSDDVDETANELAEEVLERANKIATEYEREIEVEVRFGKPAKAIVNEAEEFDTVVIGTHRGSLAERLFVGNIAKKVFKHSPVPVTVVR